MTPQMTSPSSARFVRRRGGCISPHRGEGRMSAAGKRLVGVAICAVVVCVLIGLYIGLYLTTSPGDASAAAVTGPNGAHLYLATVAASELDRPASELGLLLRRRRKGPELAPRDHIRAARQLARARDDLSVRRSVRPAQPVHRRRRRGSIGGTFAAQRQAHGGDRSRRRLAHLRDPADGRVRSAVRHPRRQQRTRATTRRAR